MTVRRAAVPRSSAVPSTSRRVRCGRSGPFVERLGEVGLRFSNYGALDHGSGARRRGLRGAHLPGSDPARGRPGAPVPVHQRPVPQPGRRGWRASRKRAADRPRQGPPLLPRFVGMPDGERFVPVEAGHPRRGHSTASSRGMRVIGSTRSGWTRNADRRSRRRRPRTSATARPGVSPPPPPLGRRSCGSRSTTP